MESRKKTEKTFLNRKYSRRDFLKITLAASAAAFTGVYFMNYNPLKGKVAKTEGEYGKVLALGVDGLDYSIMSKLMSEGELPNFSAVMDAGSYCPLETSLPPNSPVAWTCIACGVNPGRHNIFDFIRRDPRTHLPELSLSRQVAGAEYESLVKATPFWDHTSAAKIPTTVIRWPVTFPAKEVEGRMLSGLGVPDVRGLLSGYTYYTSDPKAEVSGGPHRVVKVDVSDETVKSMVVGPKTVNKGELVDATAPVEVKITGGDSVQVHVSGKKYNLKQGRWSDWLRVNFEVGFMKSVSGIFKAILVGTNPLRLYVTSIQVDPANPVVDISYPRGYSKELAESVGLYYTLGMPEETSGYVDERFGSEAMLSQITEIEMQRDAMFWKGFRDFEKKGGVYAFVYDSSDRVQHVFWEHKVLENKGELRISSEIRNYLKAKDRFIGELIDRIGEDTLFMVFSDHGFTSFERSVNVNRWLVENNFLTLKKKIPDGEDGSLFKYVDWAKTKAYSVGFNSVYLNLAGRESRGVVRDRQDVVSELAEALEAMVDEKTGKKPVDRAYTREEAYSGDLVGDAPDIILGFEPGYRMSWQNAVGGFTDEVIFDNEKRWCGDHLVDPRHVPGVLFSNVRLGRKQPSQMDVSPTILDALGVDENSATDGETLIG